MLKVALVLVFLSLKSLWYFSGGSRRIALSEKVDSLNYRVYHIRLESIASWSVLDEQFVYSGNCLK